MADMTPITREEAIIAGQDLEPKTRLEYFLKQYGGGGGGSSAKILYINGTKDSQGTHVTLDKTYAEIKAFVEGGGIPVIAVPSLPYAGTNYYILENKYEGLQNQVVFAFIGNKIDKTSSAGEIVNVTLALSDTENNVARVSNESKNLYKGLSGTLTAGSTTLTISDTSITTSSIIDYYTESFSCQPTDIVVAEGSVTLTFEAQQKNIGVKVRVW